MSNMIIKKIKCWFVGHEIQDRKCIRCGTGFGVPKMPTLIPPPEKLKYMGLGPIMSRQEQMARELLRLIHDWESYDEGMWVKDAYRLRLILASMVGNKLGIIPSSDQDVQASVARKADSSTEDGKQTI